VLVYKRSIIFIDRCLPEILYNISFAGHSHYSNNLLVLQASNKKSIMIELMDLRTGNYIHPASAIDQAKADTEKYMRILSVDLLNRKVNAKEDNNKEIHTFEAARIFGCSIENITRLMGGFSFNEHSMIIKGEGEVLILHENGSMIALPHIHHLHQFQNLFRSLTGQEFPFNIGN
jgi:hypothetical protein